MASESDLDVTATVAIALIGALVLILTVIAVQAFYYRTEDRLYQEAYAQPNLDVAKVKAEQQALLVGYSLPEPGKGTIHIPIQRAMELVAREATAPPARSPQNTGRP